ncbi:OTU domain-containing protein [Pseudomonas sp. MDT1-17]
MINLTAVSASTSNVDTQLDVSASASRATPCNPQDAAFIAITTRGDWDSQYLEQVATSLPKLSQWPAWRGLVIIEQERIQRYDVAGSQPVDKGNIDPNDVIIARSDVQYMSRPNPGMEFCFLKNGDGFFRAVLAGLHGQELDDRTEAKLLPALRGQVADYVYRNWDDFKDFVVPGREPLAGDATLEPLGGAAVKPSPLPEVPGGVQSMETFKQASGIGKPSFITMLMTQVQALLAPALEAIRGAAFTEKDTHGLAVALRLVNRTIADAPLAEKAEWIERCLQDLFSSDAKHPVSKAEAILQHRNVAALTPLVNELMTFMENTAQTLQGDALVRLGELLGVDIAVDGMGRGIGRSFSSEASTSGPVEQFRARFENLREEFDIAF